jgi:FkbM family methyltransferase
VSRIVLAARADEGGTAPRNFGGEVAGQHRSRSASTAARGDDDTCGRRHRDPTAFDPATVIIRAVRGADFIVDRQRLARRSMRAARHSGGSRQERARLVATIGRLHLLAARHRVVPVRPPVTVSGLTLYVGNFDHFVYAFEEIFVNAIYGVSLPGASPRIVDCGANIGLSVIYFKRRFPDATIIAFEPEEANYALLQENVAANELSSVTCHRVALGDNDGTALFHVDPGIPGSLMGALGAPLARPYLVASQTVTVRRLSSYLDAPIDLLKLDIEGSEGMVLADLVATGKIELVNRMVIEYHHHLGTAQLSLAQSLMLLEEAGFDFRIATPGYGNAVEGPDFEDVFIYAYRPV